MPRCVVHSMGRGRAKIYERWPVQDNWLKFYWKGHTPSLITRDDAVQRLQPPQRGAVRL